MLPSNKEKIRSMIEFNPAVLDSEIAEALNITRQGVHYHTKDMKIQRTRSVPTRCSGCSKPILKSSISKMCALCRRESYAYEFKCAHCGKLNVLYGSKASIRRKNDKKKQSDKNFCNQSCAAKHTMRRYWGLRKLEESKGEL